MSEDGVTTIPRYHYANLKQRLSGYRDQLTQKDKQIELLLGCVEFYAKYGSIDDAVKARETLEKYRQFLPENKKLD